MKKEYYLFVRREKIKVEKEIYIEYQKIVCRQKYGERRYMKYILPLDTLADENLCLEEEAIKEISIEKLHQALKQLDDEEYRLIFELFFNGRSERSLARDLDVHPMTIHSKKAKILQKLKKIMKN